MIKDGTYTELVTMFRLGKKACMMALYTVDDCDFYAFLNFLESIYLLVSYLPRDNQLSNLLRKSRTSEFKNWVTCDSAIPSRQ